MVMDEVYTFSVRLIGELKTNFMVAIIQVILKVPTAQKHRLIDVT